MEQWCYWIPAFQTEALTLVLLRWDENFLYGYFVLIWKQKKTKTRNTKLLYKRSKHIYFNRTTTPVISYCQVQEYWYLQYSAQHMNVTNLNQSLVKQIRPLSHQVDDIGQCNSQDHLHSTYNLAYGKPYCNDFSFWIRTGVSCWPLRQDHIRLASKALARQCSGVTLDTLFSIWTPENPANFNEVNRKWTPWFCRVRYFVTILDTQFQISG